MPKILGNSLSEHRERTRDALFTALGELLSERTFDKITLSDVATRAHVGRTAVYNHFADKEDLLLAFMDHETRRYAGKLHTALSQESDPVEQLRIYIHAQALLKRHYHIPVGGRLSEAVSSSTIGRLHAHAGLMEETLTKILRDAMESGQIPPQALPATVSLIHATVLGGRQVPDEEQARREYLDTLDTYVLRAVGAQPATRPVSQSIDFESGTATAALDSETAVRSLCPVAH